MADSHFANFAYDDYIASLIASTKLHFYAVLV